jgi:Mn2+/Fe2+ NRAMP family transporter
MQAMVAPIWLTITAMVIAAIIILLNIKLISDIIK